MSKNNIYQFRKTGEFEAFVIAETQQEAIEILNLYIDYKAYNYLFDRSNIIACSSDVPEHQSKGVHDFEHL